MKKIIIALALTLLAACGSNPNEAPVVQANVPDMGNIDSYYGDSIYYKNADGTFANLSTVKARFSNHSTSFTNLSSSR